MTTAGIKWCNGKIPEIFEFCLKKHVFDRKFRNFDFLSEIVVHKLKTPSKSEHSNARYDILKIKSNKELHISMQIALNNRKSKMGYTKSVMSF